MNSGTKRVSDLAKKTFFSFFPLCIFFYLILTKSFPRSGYPIIKTKVVHNTISRVTNTIENSNAIKIRKKLINDLKIHSTHKSFKKHYITKVIINKEGKIIGYKFYRLFYPNYFTKIQDKNLMKNMKIIKSSRGLFLIIINYN